MNISGPSETGVGAGGGCLTPYFCRQINPITTKEADYAYHIKTPLFDFQTFRFDVSNLEVICDLMFQSSKLTFQASNLTFQTFYLTFHSSNLTFHSSNESFRKSRVIFRIRVRGSG